MAQIKRSGTAMLGAEDAQEGELVLYEMTLSHEGGAPTGFSCTVRSAIGGDLAHLFGRPLVMEVAEGPTLGVAMIHVDRDQAMLQLR